jgi:hypothetical protein
MTGGEWTLLDAGGGNAVTFTSFMGMNVRNEGRVLSHPVERGGFASYNKVESPLAITVTLAVQGSEPDFAGILLRLEEYKREAVRLAVATPAALHESMTLQAYSYRRDREAGAGMLTVELSLVEVREVETRVTASLAGTPKNPTSSGKVYSGKKQTESVESGSGHSVAPTGKNG